MPMKDSGMTNPILVMDVRIDSSIIEQIYKENCLIKDFQFSFSKENYNEANNIIKKFFNKKRYMNFVLDKKYFNFYRVMRNLFLLRYMIENPNHGIDFFYEVSKSNNYYQLKSLPSGINPNNKVTIDMTTVLFNTFSDKREKYMNFINFCRSNNIFDTNFVRFIYQYCVLHKYFDIRYVRRFYVTKKVPEMFLIKLMLKFGFFKVIDYNDMSKLENEIDQLNMLLKFKNINIIYRIVRPETVDYNIICEFVKFNEELQNITSYIKQNSIHASDFNGLFRALCDESFCENRMIEVTKKYFSKENFFNMLLMKNKIVTNNNIDINSFIMFMLFYKTIFHNSLLSKVDIS